MTSAAAVALGGKMGGGDKDNSRTKVAASEPRAKPENLLIGTGENEARLFS